MNVQKNILGMLFGENRRVTAEMLSSLSGIPADVVFLSDLGQWWREGVSISRNDTGIPGVLESIEEGAILRLALYWDGDVLYCETTHKGWRGRHKIERCQRQNRCKDIAKLMTRTLASRPVSENG